VDTVNQGHQEHIHINGPWPVKTTAYDDELLTSWLIRSALANGCDPISLTSYLWGSWRTWATDLDRNIPQQKLNILSDMFPANTVPFQKMTLPPIIHQIHNQQFPSNSISPWILSLGIRNRNRKGGLQYCPKCFETEEPYYRINWRLAWHTCCSKHQTQLLDKCHECGLVLEPHKLKADCGSMKQCTCCKALLTEQIAPPVSQNTLLFQATCDQALQMGQVNFYGSNLSSQRWFELCIFLILFIKRIAKMNHQKLLHFVHIIKLPFQSIPNHTAALENMTTNHRFALFHALQHLLSTHPNQIMNALLEADVSQQAFAPKNVLLPGCYQNIYNQLPQSTYNRAEKKYLKAPLPRPRPRHEVERKALDIIRALHQ